jgi:transcriptional regulator with XRE-family HTH domain
MSEQQWLNIFGDNLLYLMHSANLTLQDLSDATGLCKSTVSKYINKQIVPGARAIVNLAYALNCSTDDLIDFGERIR